MRRRYITHPRFQFRFVFAYVRGALISIGFSALLLFATLYLLAHDPFLRPDQAAELSAFLKTLGFVFLGMVAVIIVCCVLLGVYLSYKMAGPVRRFEDWLVQKNTAEDVAPLVLRPGDEWVSVVALLNQLTGNKGNKR